MDGLRITKFRREGDRWLANISSGGRTIAVQSDPVWSTTHDMGERFRTVLPVVAAELQRKVKSASRREAVAA